MEEVEFREVISPERMVFGRRGIGGPQPEEVERMLTDERAAIAADTAWLEPCRDRLARAEAALDQAFGGIAQA